MKARTYLFLMILASLTLLMIPLRAEAADLTIDCPSSESSKCALLGANPLFAASDGVWYPGRTLTKSVRVKNSGANGKNISFQARRSSNADGVFEQAFLISVTPLGSNTITFGGNLTNLYDKDRISFGAFDSNQTKEFMFQVKMDTNAGNDTKNKESKFSATIGFWEESKTTLPCADPAPSAPTLVSVTGSENQATLVWLPAAGGVTYYAVYYGTSPGSSSLLNPNVGGSSTVSYAAQGLTNTTYYFRVLAGNGCAQSPFSNERALSLGEEIAVAPTLIASEEKEGAQPSVQGAAEQEVKGETIIPSKEAIGGIPSFISNVIDFVKQNPVAAGIAVVSLSVGVGSILWQFLRKP